LLSPIHHQTPRMLPSMVARQLNQSCFAVLTSCHLFSVRPELSPCAALENWVLHNMSCTWRKKEEKNFTIRLSKQKLLKINSRIKLSEKNSYGKSIQLIKNYTTLRWRWSLWDKVLCRKVAAKRVEDGVDNQSVCSQVLCETNLSACGFKWWKLLPVLLIAAALLTCGRTTLPAKL
jgi:hypothetical protein